MLFRSEKGAYATIELSWKDDSGTLKIGKRSGSFAGMPESIAFTVEIIGKGSESIVYNGDEVVCKAAGQ